MTPAELYAVAFQNPNPTHFAMVPHIVDHLTYNVIDAQGVKQVKRLSPNAIHLYRVLIRIAGEDGACWMNRDNLAELCNLSAGSITNAKKELLQEFNELDKKPLIILQECQKSKVVDGEIKNKTMYHKIMIMDIWRHNNAYMKTKKWLVNTGHCHEMTAPGGALSCGDGAPGGALSCGDTNNNTNTKTHLSKEQQPDESSSPVCLLDKSVDVVSVDVQETAASEKERDAFNYLLKVGFDVFGATGILKSYTIEQISEASKYFCKQRDARAKKNEPILNFPGYFRKVLEQKWYLPKPA